MIPRKPTRIEVKLSDKEEYETVLRQRAQQQEQQAGAAAGACYLQQQQPAEGSKEARDARIGLKK